MSYHGLGFEVPSGPRLPSGSSGPTLTATPVRTVTATLTGDRLWDVALAAFKAARATRATVPVAAEAGRQAAAAAGATTAQQSDIALRLLRYAALTPAIAKATTAYRVAMDRGAGTSVAKTEAGMAATRSGARTSEVTMVVGAAAAAYRTLVAQRQVEERKRQQQQERDDRAAREAAARAAEQEERDRVAREAAEREQEERLAAEQAAREEAERLAQQSKEEPGGTGPGPWDFVPSETAPPAQAAEKKRPWLLIGLGVVGVVGVGYLIMRKK